MVTNSGFKEELKKLKKVSYSKIKNYSSVAVNVPISVLSMKERGKAIWVLGSTLLKARTEYDKVAAGYMQLKAIINKKIGVVEDDDPKRQETYTYEEVAQILKELHAHEIPKELLKVNVRPDSLTDE